jgi:SNF2 family DNA or RNA helicase
VDAKLREAESAKVDALEDLLEPPMKEGHKALVFSQLVTMLDLLRKTLRPKPDVGRLEVFVCEVKLKNDFPAFGDIC